MFHLRFHHRITSALRSISRLFRRRSNTSNSVDQASGQPQQHHSPGTPAKKLKNGLFCLHNPDGDFYADIVAVHGLSGDWEETWTWTDGTTKKLWLRDFLPLQFPGLPVRVWSFGYDASIFGKAVINIENVAAFLVSNLDGQRQGTHSTKPIIFIAHSLGGIIVKKALILAHERSNTWHGIRDSTYGAMFFGVPHRGADLAYWAEHASRVVDFASFGLWRRNKFLKVLQKNSQELFDIANAVVEQAGRLDIRSFFETKMIGNDIVVTQNSATIGMANEQVLPILGADHRNMCKFDSESSPSYSNVKTALNQMVSAASHIGDSMFKKKVIKLNDRAKDWQQMITNESQKQDSDWIISMSDTQSWVASKEYGLLHAEYDASWGWQATLSNALSTYLSSKEFHVIYGLAPTDYQELLSESWKADLPRVLLAQILSYYQYNSSQIQKVFMALQSNEVGQNMLEIPWQNVFCSENSPWEQQWMLLYSVLGCLGRKIVISLVGFEDKLYQTLDKGLRKLDPRHYSDPSRYSSRDFFSIRHKTLVIGAPRSEPPSDSGHTLSSRIINESTEIKECQSSLFFEELNARRMEIQNMGRGMGTTEWIWEHEVYEQWLNQDSSLLWIHGKAGSGKSTLAAALQQRSIHHNPRELLIADFFYSTGGGPTAKGHLWMLRSILYQLLKQQPNLYCFYRSVFRKLMGSNGKEWDYNALTEVLLRLGDQIDDSNDKYTFFFILDGLDESEDGNDPKASRKQTFNLFSRLCHSPKRCIFKVIALSRSEYPIQQALNPKYSINMGHENKGSIEKIARYGIHRIYNHMNSNSGSLGDPGTYNATSLQVEDVPDIHELGFLKDYLLNNADGVILWVVLVISKIVSQIEGEGVSSVFDLKQILKTVPKTLTAFYQDMLARLNISKNSELKRLEKSRFVFSWLLFSTRKLSVCEIREVIAMFGWDNLTKDERHSFLRDHRTILQENDWNPTWKQLHASCGGFAEIVPYEKSVIDTVSLSRNIDPDDTVQLIHRTAGEFLTSSELGIDFEGGVYSIGMACVNYLELLLTVDHDIQAENSPKTLCFYLERRPLLRFILLKLHYILSIQVVGENSKISLLYVRILEHIADATQMQIPQAMWFFKQWNRLSYTNSSLEIRGGQCDIPVGLIPQSLYKEIQRHKELHIFNSTLRPMAYAGILDTSIIESLKTRMEQNEVRCDTDLEKFTPEMGAFLATELQCPTALDICHAVFYRGHILEVMQRGKLMSHRNERLVRRWMRCPILPGHKTPGNFRLLNIAAKEGNATIVKELLTWDTKDYYMAKWEEIEKLAKSLDETKTTIGPLLDKYLALMRRYR
ncbi:hypothetical protein F5Y02DRAFT_374104 [Annulohypoxylon stygium]|nr:hypothetical protein F5Y02DRAFT_374104 [Annulohypoxylon stygium]